MLMVNNDYNINILDRSEQTDLFFFHNFVNFLKQLIYY